MNSIFVLSVVCVIVHFVVSVRAIGPLGAFGVGVGSSKCDPSITTASGTYAMHKGKPLSYRRDKSIEKIWLTFG